MKIKLGLGKIDMRDVAGFCGGELYDYTKNGCSAEYVCTDSREADENTLFIATRGERVDGHDYICASLEAGASCVLSEKDMENDKVLAVKDSPLALGVVARAYKEKYRY